MKAEPIERPRLAERLAAAVHHRLTVLHAPAGAGKSVLLRVLGRRENVVRYRATSRDASVGPLAVGLARSLRPVLPGLGDDPVSALEVVPAAVAGEDGAQRGGFLAGILCESLARQPATELTLLLDDIDHIPASAPAWHLLDALLRQAPSGFRVVTAGRSTLPLAVERLRRHAGVVEIGADELAFTAEEAEEALVRWLGQDAAALAEPVLVATQGRPGAVRLVAELLATLPSETRRRRLADESAGGIDLEAVAVELLARRPLPVRELLRTMLCLERCTIDLCEHLGQAHAERILPELVRSGLFVEELPGQRGWFALTRFGRDLLGDQLTPDAWERQAILRRAAEWFEGGGLAIDAVRCLQQADADDVLKAVLVRCGGRLLELGHDDTLLDAAATMPPGDRSPDLELLVGTALQLRGADDDALAAFRRAAADRDELPAMLAYRTGLVHHLRGELDSALAAYERGRLDGSAPADEAMLLAWTSSVWWLRGEAEACRELAEAALTRAVEAGDAQALAAAHTAGALVAALDGDRMRNDAHYRRALRNAERAGDLLQVVRIRTNRSSHHLEEGAYAQAEEEATQAVVLGEIAGVSWFRALALSNRGEARFWLGRLDAAIEDLEAARRLYHRLGSHGVAYPLAKLGDVLRERGDIALARAAYEEAVRHAEHGSDMQALVPALAGLAELLAPEDTESAGELAARAVDCGHGMSHVQALLAAAKVALHRGEPDEAERLAREAAAQARSRRDHAGLATALEIRALAARDPAPLGEAARIWADIAAPLGQARVALLAAVLADAPGDAVADAERRLRELGSRWRPVDVGGGEDETLPDVEIRSLGGLRVLRRGEAVGPTAWQSKKARDLLKLLVARRGRPVPRDVLMDSLWPEEDPARIGNRLSVTLSTVRSVLDPDKRHPADHFLAADKDAVWLELHRCAVDVEQFVADATEGLALRAGGATAEASAKLARAEALYQGDFLEEDPYSEWAVALREEARALYVEVARALADDAAAAGQHDLASRYQLRVLERDPYDERAHLELVQALVAAARHGEARRCYRTYVSRMAELNIEPRPFPAQGGKATLT